MITFNFVKAAHENKSLALVQFLQEIKYTLQYRDFWAYEFMFKRMESSPATTIPADSEQALTWLMYVDLHERIPTEHVTLHQALLHYLESKIEKASLQSVVELHELPEFVLYPIDLSGISATKLQDAATCIPSKDVSIIEWTESMKVVLSKLGLSPIEEYMFTTDIPSLDELREELLAKSEDTDDTNFELKLKLYAALCSLTVKKPFVIDGKEVQKIIRRILWQVDHLMKFSVNVTETKESRNDY